MTDGELRAVEVAKEVDCEGAVCPGPVLKSMEALNQVGSGEVVVLKTDLEMAAKNVSVAVETGGLAEILGTLEDEGLFFLYMKRI